MILTIFDIVYQQWLPQAKDLTYYIILKTVGHLVHFLSQAKLIALNENLIQKAIEGLSRKYILVNNYKYPTRLKIVVVANV